MSKTTKYPALKAEIKKRQEHSQQVLRYAIQNSIELERHHAWCQKQWYGKDTRNLLLVYAFLRNVPYIDVECRSHRSRDSLAAEVSRFKQNFPELWESLPEEAVERFTNQTFCDWMAINLISKEISENRKKQALRNGWGDLEADG